MALTREQMDQCKADALAEDAETDARIERMQEFHNTPERKARYAESVKQARREDAEEDGKGAEN
jgi:hypothetical protein